MSWKALTLKLDTAWKLSKYGIFSGPYFPVFIPNTRKYGPEQTPCLDTFHPVRAPISIWIILWIVNHLIVKLIQLIDIVLGNIFERLGPKSKPFLIYQPTSSNQKLKMPSL